MGEFPKIKSRRTIDVSPWMKVIEREVAYKNGSTELYHAVGQPDYVAIVALTPDGRIPVVRQYRPALERFTWELPAGTVDTLVKPENKKKLTGILTYHVVAGAMTADKLMAEIKAGNGKATLKTVNGESLTAKTAGDSIELTDSKGGTAKVTIANVMQSNGVIHVIDSVLMP